MQSLVAVALHKATADLAKQASSQINVGVHQVDTSVTVHLVGTVKKLADGSYCPNPDYKAALAWVLLLLNEPRDKARVLARKAIERAIQGDLPARYVDRLNDIDAELDDLKATGGIELKPRAGALSAQIVLTDLTMPAQKPALQAAA